ncbi:MmyB family transcriptional regulator [Streptomyces asiaticus]|uniref:helix-turn-helix domain-containing protein n=1 Tax=Streptomyces asiaticus TaxID=114695 RepID=UPI003D724B61
MTVSDTSTRVGPLLRLWRNERKVSQADLALCADTSARHISFIETGRSRPSRELLERLADRLQVPIRQRNALLVAAGYAPVYQETSLEAPRMRAVKEAVDRILGVHMPFPALAVDADEHILAMNRSTELLLRETVQSNLLVPPVNVMRMALHPAGMVRHVLNAEEWKAHLLSRLYRQAVYSNRESLWALYNEMAGYRIPDESGNHELSDSIVALIELRAFGTVLRLFSTITTFGATTDVTVAELSLETLHPADDHTASVFQQVVKAAGDSYGVSTISTTAEAKVNPGPDPTSKTASPGVTASVRHR